MKTQDVTGAVWRMSRRVVSPTLPRVKASFQTIYRQCQPAKLAENLPTFQWSQRVRSAMGKLAQVKMPRIKLPRVRLPDVQFKRPVWLKLPPNPFKRAKAQAEQSPLAMVLDGRMSKRRFRMPRLKLPRFSMPQIALPRFSFPRISLPTFSLPRPVFPRLFLRLPRFRIELPSISTALTPALSRITERGSKMIAATGAYLARMRRSAIDSGTQLVARIPRSHSPIQQSINSNTGVRLSLRMRFSLDEWTQVAAFGAGYTWGLCLDRMSSLWNGKDTKQKMLVAIDSPLAEALLFEPVLRSLRQHYRDRLLHLWATREVCQLYSAAPYISKLQVIEDRHDQTRLNRRRQWRSNWEIGRAIGRHHYSLAIVDILASKVSRYCTVRGARTEAICVLDHQGNARERMEPSGRLLRHMPFSNKSDPMDSLALLAEQWRGRILGDVPRVFPCDLAAQLAYSRARSWRSQAATIGAGSIVALVPCAHPPDQTLTVGLRLWAHTARELWSRHKALPIIFAEGADSEAIDQLSSLLGEVPHVKLGGDMEILERAGMLARLDLVIASAGGTAQLAAAQGVPSIIVGSAPRKRLYAWVGSRSIYLHPDSAGRLDTADVMHAYRRLTMTPLPQRVAV